MLDFNFFKKFINFSKKEKLIIDLYVSKNLKEVDILELINNCDYKIENEDLSFNFLLAQIFKNNPHIQIPKDIEPRLKGILVNNNYKNVTLLSALKMLVKELNKQNIPIMLLKGSAMRLLGSTKYRTMSDVDCAVPIKDFNKVLKISKNIGFKIDSVYKHATTICKNRLQQIDIHTDFIKGSSCSKKLCEEIFKRAKEYNFYGSKVLIPNCEDMILLLFNNGYDNIVYSQSFYKRASWLLDSFYIIDNSEYINWNLIIENAKLSHISSQIKIMIELFNWLIPNIIPQNLTEKIQISKEEKKYFEFYTKTHLFFSEAQQIKDEIKKIMNIKNKKVRDISLLIKLVSEFLYLKIVQKTPIINTLLFDKTVNRIFKI